MAEKNETKPVIVINPSGRAILVEVPTKNIVKSGSNGIIIRTSKPGVVEENKPKKVQPNN